MNQWIKFLINIFLKFFPYLDFMCIYYKKFVLQADFNDIQSNLIIFQRILVRYK